MLTLIEAAKTALNNGEVLRASIIETYAMQSDILQFLPFEDIPGGAYRYNQEHTLPGIGFRGVNEAYSESTGVLNPEVEPLVIAGGDLDVDTFILETMGEGQRTTQEQMKMKALAHRWTNAFIKGDSTGNPREFDGLQARLTGSQLIDAGATSGGDALTLTKLDELIDSVENPSCLIMNRTLKRLLSAAARNPSVSGYITYTPDAFGRQIMMYNGLPILIADRLGDAYATLAFNEANPGGGSNVGTSIYCVSFGDGACMGIQTRAATARDLGELETKPAKRTRVEWFAGIALTHPRCAARLRGIKNAAVAA